MSATHQPPQIVAPVLCPTFEKESKRIWDDFGDTYNGGLACDEETITNNLLLAILRAHPAEVRHVQFGHHEEAQGGADWEWWLTDGYIWIGLLIQAKRLDPSSHKYPGIKKVGSDGTSQIDALIHHAASKGIDPLYFFYNYSTSPIENFRWNCRRHIEKKLLGCTVAHGLAVNNVLGQGGAGLPKLSDISFPMRCIVCCRFFADPDESLPGRANGIVKELRARADNPNMKYPVPREKPPEYVARLMSVPRGAEAALVEELSDEVGKVGALVVIKERRER